MSILSTIRSWTTEIGVYHAGSLYREDNFPLSRLLRKVLSKVRVTDETVEGLKSLPAKGVVVYALKNRSQLNSLILRDLSIRKGIPQPVYCHGINMMTWQPYSQALRVILSHIFHRLFKKASRDPAKMEYLKELVREGKSAIIHLGESELFENPFVEETRDRILAASCPAGPAFEGGELSCGMPGVPPHTPFSWRPSTSLAVAMQSAVDMGRIWPESMSTI